MHPKDIDYLSLLTQKVTDLLHIDDLKTFAASETRLSCVMKSVKAVMEDVGLQWNPKKCAVVHVKRGTHVADSAGLKVDGNAEISSLEDGQHSSIETEYKERKVKVAVNLYQNRDPAMKMVQDFEERVERVGNQALTTEVVVYAEEYGLNLLKRDRESREREEVREQRWQGKLVTERERDKGLSAEQCFLWLSDWRTCPTHTIAGMFELYEQLLPTRLYTIHKTRVSDSSGSACSLCGTAPEGMAHILSACPALAQTKFLARHDAVVKVLFFDIFCKLGLRDTVPPWYSAFSL